MPVKLKNVDGLMLKKENLESYISDGFIYAIDQQGSREIGLNKEKLIPIIYYCINFNDERIKINDCIVIADAMIAKEHELIEYKKD